MCLTQSQCIEHQFKCDGTFDCNDNSDESDCPDVLGDCDFQNDTWIQSCGWSQLEDDDFDWIRVDKAEDGPDGGHDITTGKSRTLFLPLDGYVQRFTILGTRTTSNYFLMALAQNNSQGFSARLATPVYPASQFICFVKFWYYMHYEDASGPDGMGTLRVYVEGRLGHDSSPLKYTFIERLTTHLRYTFIYFA